MTNSVSKEQLLDQLKNPAAEVTVVFTKKDGTERSMRCTLAADLLPASELNENRATRAANPDVLRVFDLDKSAWRSFRYDSIKQVKVM